MTSKMRIIGLLKRSLNDFWFHCSALYCTVMYCTVISAQLNSHSAFYLLLIYGTLRSPRAVSRRATGGRGYRINFFLNPHISGGGCIILNKEKTAKKFFFLFRVGQVCGEKILNLYFRGKFYFFWGQFQIWGNLKFCAGGAFFCLGKFVYGKS